VRRESDVHRQIADAHVEVAAQGGDVTLSLQWQTAMRGLLTDGRRKSMQPMAERLGVNHQRLQQFITSSTWDYAAVRANVARWFAGHHLVEALVVDDTGFPKDGDASPCVARQYSGTLGKIGNCQIGVSVHLVNEHASCAADWRLFCPESWDDQALEDPVAAAGAARRRTRQLLAVCPARQHPHRRAGAPGQDPLADRARLPRAENRPRPGPLRRPLLPRLAPPRHPRRPRPGLLHPAPQRPKVLSPG
jgi:DDE superfamily endonuclease